MVWHSTVKPVSADIFPYPRILLPFCILLEAKSAGTQNHRDTPTRLILVFKKYDTLIKSPGGVIGSRAPLKMVFPKGMWVRVPPQAHDK